MQGASPEIRHIFRCSSALIASKIADPLKMLNVDLKESATS